MSSIDYTKTSRSDFNNSTEREVQSRVGAYNLDKSESSQIWELIQNREKALIIEKTNFKENYPQYVKTEYDRLKAERINDPQLNYGPTYSSDRQLYHLACQNVRAGYLQREKNHYQNTDMEIDKILHKARENERGPVPEIQRDFQKTNDRQQTR